MTSMVEARQIMEATVATMATMAMKILMAAPSQTIHTVEASVATTLIMIYMVVARQITAATSKEELYEGQELQDRLKQQQT